MAQKCVIVRRDEQGFGLRVSGDNPVTVDYVKPGLFVILFFCFIFKTNILRK